MHINALWDSVIGMKPLDAINVLQARGMTETAIAVAVGVRQSTINRIKNGKHMPNWEIGRKLVDLAKSEPAETA